MEDKFLILFLNQIGCFDFFKVFKLIFFLFLSIFLNRPLTKLIDFLDEDPSDEEIADLSHSILKSVALKIGDTIEKYAEVDQYLYTYLDLNAQLVHREIRRS